MDGVVNFGEHAIKYSLVERHDSRSIYLKFSGEQLMIFAPSSRGIDKLFEKHGRWIVKHYKQIKNSVKLFQEDSMLLLGSRYYLAYRPSAHPSVEMGPNIITMSGRSRQAAQRALKEWVGEKTLKFTAPLAIEKAHLLNRKIEEIKIRRSRKWGTCTKDRIITFNSFLAMLPSELMEYVVCHEVSHLVELNHSKRFWNTVSMICLNYKNLRKELYKYDNSEVKL